MTTTSSGGHDLKSFRFKHKMNQTEFAAYLDYTVGQYNQWEHQKR